MYTTNTTLEAIAQRLRSARRVLVLTHLKPDGDAVGSTLGVVRALNRPSGWVSASTPKAQVWYYGPPPPWLQEMCGDTPYQLITNSNPPPVDQQSEPDAIILLDTGAWTQVEPVADWLSTRRDRILVVDHHAQGDEDLSPCRYVEVAAAAVCQPAAELCRLLLDAPSIASLPETVADALYLGLATDTGWFRHSNVNPAVMETAAMLLRAGANHVRLNHMTEQNSLGRLKLISKALSTLEIHSNGRLAIMSATRADIEGSGAAPGDSGGLTDFTQALPGIRVSAMLTEATASDYRLENSATGPLTKISMRSKSIAPAVDVNAITKQMGGGGHVRAAGARMAASIEETKAHIISLVDEQLRNLT